MSDPLTHLALGKHDMVGPDPLEDATVLRRDGLGPDRRNADIHQSCRGEDAGLQPGTDGDDGSIELIDTELTQCRVAGGIGLANSR
jgi:hypothetical protein